MSIDRDRQLGRPTDRQTDRHSVVVSRNCPYRLVFEFLAMKEWPYEEV